jgi:hypothetical protein
MDLSSRKENRPPTWDLIPPFAECFRRLHYEKIARQSQA